MKFISFKPGPHFPTCCNISLWMRKYCYILQYSAHTLPWKFIRGNRGTSATASFVPTPSGSRRRLRAGSSRGAARPWSRTKSLDFAIILILLHYISHRHRGLHGGLQTRGRTMWRNCASIWRRQFFLDLYARHVTTTLSGALPTLHPRFILCLVVWCRRTEVSPTFSADAVNCHQHSVQTH